MSDQQSLLELIKEIEVILLLIAFCLGWFAGWTCGFIVFTKKQP